MSTPRHPSGRPEGGQFRPPAGDAAATTAADGAQAAHQAGEQAAQARMDHYEQRAHGQGSACGDPMPAVSTEQPEIGVQSAET